MSNNTFAIKSSCQIVRPRKKRKRFILEDEPLVKDEVGGSAYKQAESAVGQGGSGVSQRPNVYGLGVGGGQPVAHVGVILVQVTETRNANGREMGDGIPTQSSAAVSANEWAILDKMEVGTTTNNLTARLPILNPGDYDLWLMKIEQYFLMTDYSLWEVIKNGNKVLKRTIGTVEQEYEPTTAEEK
ncbi:hypothetical protein Tco_0930335 [Tanacetum coccineum]